LRLVDFAFSLLSFETLLSLCYTLFIVCPRRYCYEHS